MIRPGTIFVSAGTVYRVNDDGSQTIGYLLTDSTGVVRFENGTPYAPDAAADDAAPTPEQSPANGATP